MTQLVCWNCGENLHDVPRPISRHANCPKCFNELHCCRLCRHFDAQNNMTCFEDRAEPPLNKENANFCDFFAPAYRAFSPETASKTAAAHNALDALFGNEEPSDADAAARDTKAENTQSEGTTPQTPLSKEALAKKKLDDLFG
jgi:hypothetical protein